MLVHVEGLGPVLTMPSLDCIICGGRSWIYPITHEDWETLACLICKSTVKAMNNQEAIDNMIAFIRSEQI